MQNKAILWDLDGTLLPSKSIVHQVLEEIFPEFGLQAPSRQSFDRCFGAPLDEFIKKHSNDHPDHKAIKDRFLEAQLKHYEDVEFFEGIVETVLRLNNLGFKQAVVTSKGNAGRGIAGASAIINNSALAPHIDIVISADDVNNRKPHPEPLLLALERLEVHPNQAIMVGDQDVDMLAAKNTGSFALGIDHENSHKTRDSLIVAGADEVVNDAHAIIPIAVKLIG